MPTHAKRHSKSGFTRRCSWRLIATPASWDALRRRRLIRRGHWQFSRNTCDRQAMNTLLVYFLWLLTGGATGASVNTVSTPRIAAGVERLLRTLTASLPELNVMLRDRQLLTDAENIHVRWFLRHCQCPLTVRTYSIDRVVPTEPQVERNRSSFVVTTNMARLRVVAAKYVKPTGVFFFVLLNDGGAIDVPQLRDILHHLWTEYSVFRLFLLTVDQGVLIYDPFAFDAQRLAYGRVVPYAGDGQTLEELLFRDMRGYPLRVQIFRSVYARPLFTEQNGKIRAVEGADGKVANLLQQRLNFSMILLDPDPNYFGERINGTYNGAIGGIIDKQIDICLTGFFVKDYMVPEMEFTVAVYDDQLCIYVHKADRVPQSILPVFAVRFDLWLGFILTAFACAAIWFAMRLLNLWLLHGARTPGLHIPLRLNLQLIRILIDTWVVWVRVNITRFPPFSSERIFLASLCLVSVIFGAIFESSLATVYIHPMYYKDINTMRELDDSRMKIIYKYSSMADDLFFNETSPLYASLNKKLEHLSNLNADVMADVAAYGGKASVTRYSTLMLESTDFIISKRIWIVPECPKYYTIAYVLPKDSPLQQAVNDLLLRFTDAGLVKKWISDMQTDVDIKMMVEHRFRNEETLKVLTVIDLQLAFYVVLAGNALAFGAFLLECSLKGRHCGVILHNPQ